jgi:predicted AlkP superfamily pyrophosphatase or phosphodiesterase
VSVFALRVWLVCVGLIGSTACRERPAQSPPAVGAARAPSVRPRLVVQITVDQLRPDYSSRFASRYGQNGLRRFVEQGMGFDSVFYAHASTETAVGHATLFTGALPAAHGVVGNEWYDRVRKRRQGAVEDASRRLLGASSPVEGGASPASLRASTIGDELSRASGGRALVYAVSLKDRGAILPAGRAGKAFWYDDRTGDFVTSDHYFREAPPFLAAFNARRSVDRYRNGVWALLRPASEYVHANEDDRAFEESYRGLGRTFPHPLESTPGDHLRTVKRTPFGDELTLELVRALLDSEAFGRDEIPDLLAISFSATDYVAHHFGPESLEAEDNHLRLDRTMAALFEVLLARVRREDLLVVLSADHGGPESPEVLRARGIDADRHDSAALVKELNDALETRFGTGSRFIADFTNPSLWLDEDAVRARGLELEAVERDVAEAVRTRRGFALAVTKSELLRGSLPSGAVYERIRANFDRERTGNVYVVPKSGWLLATDPRGLTTMHGTPWDHDVHVPLVFWGAQLRAGRVTRPVDPRDIAVTLAELLGVPRPSAASGRLLEEVVAAASGAAKRR